MGERDRASADSEAGVKQPDTRDPTEPVTAEPRTRPTALRLESIRAALTDPRYRSMSAYAEAQDLLAEVDALRAENERLRNEQPWRGVFRWEP